jgi:hypothetical protein
MTHSVEANKVSLRADLSAKSKADLIPYKKKDDGDRMSSWRWCCGGGAYIFDRRYVGVLQRSENAPTNPGRWTIPTGRASCLEELLEPRLLIREAFEELIIGTSGGFMVPRLEAADVGLSEVMHPSWSPKTWILDALSVLNKQPSHQSLQCFDVHIDFSNLDRLVVVSDYLVESSIDCCVYLSDRLGFGDVNIMFPLHVSAKQVSLGNLGTHLLDSEYALSDGGVMQPLRRTTGVVDLTTMQILSADGYETRVIKKELAESEWAPHAWYFLQKMRSRYG